MTKDAIKALMTEAVGPKGQPDEHWHHGGTERLYFQDPQDINAAGSVEAREGESAYVRVELFCTPEKAAEIIQLVTGQKSTATKKSFVQDAEDDDKIKTATV